jgi:hypothetical protein
MVVHAFNPSTQEAEAGGFPSSRPAWSTEWVPGKPELHRETLSRKKKKNSWKKMSIIIHLLHKYVQGFRISGTIWRTEANPTFQEFHSD